MTKDEYDQLLKEEEEDPLNKRGIWQHIIDAPLPVKRVEHHGLTPQRDLLTKTIYGKIQPPKDHWLAHRIVKVEPEESYERMMLICGRTDETDEAVSDEA